MGKSDFPNNEGRRKFILIFEVMCCRKKSENRKRDMEFSR